jgi:hypothetical protein
MTKLITSEKDKAEILTLLKASIQALILDGASFENRVKIFQHVEWLERNLTEFNVEAQLQSSQMQTKFTFTVFHGAGKFTNG